MISFPPLLDAFLHFGLVDVLRLHCIIHTSSTCHRVGLGDL